MEYHNPTSSHLGSDRPHPQLPQSSCRLHILLVEDHGPSASILSFLLRQAGHTVFVSANVRQAMALAAAQPIDLVITDITLPDGDGRELMADLHHRFHVKGIAMTGHVGLVESNELKNHGFVDAVPKPIEFADLFAAIDHAAHASSHTSS